MNYGSLRPDSPKHGHSNEAPIVTTRLGPGRFLLLMVGIVAILAVACGSNDGAGLEVVASTATDEILESLEPETLVLTPTGPSPAFAVSTPEHGVYDLDRLSGKPILLNFWFPSCPPCRAELPDLQAAYEKHGDEIQFLGVQLLGLDSAEEAEEFLQELGIEYPSGPDAESQMVRDFKVVGFPTTIFINSNHDIVRKHAGILSEESVESLIAATIASGETTSTPGS